MTKPTSKATRFDNFLSEPSTVDRPSWPVEGVVYLGHIPYGFHEEQLTAYFSQYGEVLSVKVGRSRHTARSKGYAFVQFAFAEVAQVVAETMNGYLLSGKVIKAHTLAAHATNPFHHASAHKYKFLNWRKMHMIHKNRIKTQEEIGKDIANLLNKEQLKKQKIRALGIQYEYPGFSALVTKKKQKKQEQ